MKQRTLELFQPSVLMNDPPPAPPSYIGPALLPVGSRMLIGGLTKVGKSWLIMEISRALVSATPLFRCPDWPVPQPVNVLVLDQELGLHSYLNRWRQVGGDLDPSAGGRLWAANVRWLHIDRDTDSTKILIDAMHETGAQVLIIDPVNQFMAGSSIDNDTIRSFLDVLNTVQEQVADSSIVMCSHFRKPSKAADGYDSLDSYNFAGGATWGNSADTLVMVERHPDTPTGHEPLHPDGWGATWRINYSVICRHGIGGGGKRCLEVVPGRRGLVVSECAGGAVTAPPAPLRTLFRTSETCQ